MTKHIAIVGGGPGGYTAAIRAAQLGAKVTLIEKDLLGGTCLNRGCIPTKTMYKSAEMVHEIRKASEFGISAELTDISGPQIRSRCKSISTQLRGGIEQLVKANGIQLLQGQGRFTGEGNTLQVESENGETTVIQPDAVILATGSKVFRIPIPGADHPHVITSDELLEMETIPKSLAIIGGGVIGMEFGSIYNVLGTQVTIIECDKVLRMVDEELLKRFVMAQKKNGITIHTGVMAKSIEPQENGLSVTVADGDKSFSVEAEYVLMSVGRAPVLEGLNLEKAGVDATRSGIVIDSHCKTTAEGIYAIGDVTGGVMLAHWAAHQGVQTVEHILGVGEHPEESPVPGCIFTFPEIATCGLTEQEAKTLHGEIKTAKFMFGANGKALASGLGEGFVKVVATGDGTLVGVHIMGGHASDLIHEGVVAVTQKMKAKDFASIIHAHPTLGEALHEAILGLEGEAIHMAPARKK